MRGGAMLVLVAAVAAPALIRAQQTTPSALFRYTATAVGLANGAGESVRLDLFRWSTNDERTQLTQKATAGRAEDVLAALKSAPANGLPFVSGESVGYHVRYAVKLPQANGGERLIVATDRRLGSWSGQVWRAQGPASGEDYPFTVIELRLSSRGDGEGKIENWTTAPVLLRPAKREGGSS